MTERVRELYVEQVRLNERPVSELNEAERVRLAELEAEDAALLDRHPPRRVAAQIDARGRPTRGRVSPMRWALPALAMAALPFVVLSLPESERADGTEVVRTKGDALSVHRRTANGAEPLVDGDRARAGDELQLGVRLTEPGYAAVVSVDGRGVLSWHLPERPGEAVLLQPGRHRLPHAYRLDDAPEFEWFVLIRSARSFPVNEVVDALQRGEMPASEDLRIESLRLEKVSR